IWVKAVDSEDLRRLTNTPEFRETNPVWSPDGREIAFVRAGHGVFIMPQSGGPERKVSDAGDIVDWTPDGKSVLVRYREGDGPYGIYQFFLDGRERRRLTHPLVGDGDWTFRVSPDGSRLAFIRYEHRGIGDLFVVPMWGGEPYRLTNWHGSLCGPVWSP